MTTLVLSVITDYLSSILKLLSEYFPNLNRINEYGWVKRPFSISWKYEHISWAAKEQLLEIIEESTLENDFNENELSEFWLRRQQELIVISEATLHILIPYASTYLFETALSQLQIIKKVGK